MLVPTRELAAQVQRELSALIDERQARRGGHRLRRRGLRPGQRKLLARGVSAVVACPGRLEDLVGTGDVVLDRADLVVLDEADRMADMGLRPAVRRLLDQTPERRQTLLFSATLDGDVDQLVRHYQHDPIRHEVAGGEADTAEVEHLFWKVPREKRVALTADIVNRTGSAIVFTRTRHGADRVARQLGQAGVKAVPIHGRRSQAQRDQALAQFTKGRAPALVATDVAARGIHVDGVGCVVHFDMADDPKDYVHRSGRTGRAGATGLVVSLVVDDGHQAMRARCSARSAAPSRSPTPTSACWPRRRPSAVLDLRPSLRSIPAWRGARRRRRRPGLRRPPSARPTSGGTSRRVATRSPPRPAGAPAGPARAPQRPERAQRARRGVASATAPTGPGEASAANEAVGTATDAAAPPGRCPAPCRATTPTGASGSSPAGVGPTCSCTCPRSPATRCSSPARRAVRAGAGATGPAGPQRRAGLLTPSGPTDGRR